LSAIGAEHLRLIVTGPSRLQAGAAATYTVSTRSIGGGPLPAEIEVVLGAPDGSRLKAYKETADEHGLLQVVIPAGLELPARPRLSVVAQHRESREIAETTLAVEPDRRVTYLAIDRPLYRPGETVRYRSLTLSRFRLTAERPTPVHFEIRGSNGTVVPGSPRDTLDDRGVAAGTFVIPNELAAGRYALVARSLDNAFPPPSRSFLVGSHRPARAGGESGAAPRKVAKTISPDSGKIDAASPENHVVLNAGAGVFPAGAPLKFHVRTDKAGLPLVAAAYCRGVQIWQQHGESGIADNLVTIPLDKPIGGVIRLVVYDYGFTPPKPAAERLVYRRPGWRLNVQATPDRKQYAPGQEVQMSLLVTDERGRPVPAVLGVSVVDEALLAPEKVPGTVFAKHPAGLSGKRSLAPFPGPAMPVEFLLAGDVDEPADLGDAADELADGELDLLLSAQRARLGEAPPLMCDNIEQIRSNYEKCLTDYQADRTEALNTLTVSSFFGGVGLLLLVAMLGLMRIVSGMHLWIPAIGATTCCLIIGAILMDPGRFAPAQDAAVPFRGYEAPLQKAEKAPGIEAAITPREHRNKPASNGSAESPLWNPMLVAGPDGKASLRFDLPNAPAAFRVTIDAHGDGRIGSRRLEIISAR
jgi:hypothetical protein